MSDQHLTAAQTAEILGVRVATVYAYVSRGVLDRTTHTTDEGQRVSLFERSAVLSLASQRARPRAGVVAALIESEVTELDPRGRLAFRGRPVDELARLPFEEALRVVWRYDAQVSPALLPSGGEGDELEPPAPQDRIMLAVMRAAARDVDRADLGSEHVYTVARSAMAAGIAGIGGAPWDPVAPAIWEAWSGRRPSEPERIAVDTSLVCLLDHELAASTMAVRVAASTHADPWMCLVAGLASLRGPRHGATSGPAARLVRTWLDDRRVDEPLYGFGHKVYEGVDPRAELILDRVRDISPDLSSEVDALIVEVAREHSVMPNVDLGLAALAVACDLPEGAPESLFMIARMAGFAAHMVEEYPHDLRFRPRAVASSDAHRSG